MLIAWKKFDALYEGGTSEHEAGPSTGVPIIEADDDESNYITFSHRQREAKRKQKVHLNDGLSSSSDSDSDSDAFSDSSLDSEQELSSDDAAFLKEALQNREMQENEIDMWDEAALFGDKPPKGGRKKKADKGIFL